MQGHFDIAMLHTPGLTQELIDAVRREGGHPAVEEYIRSFQQDAEWHVDNLVFQTYPGYLYYKALQGAMYYPLDYVTTPTAFGLVTLETESTEPSYSSTSGTGHNYAGNFYYSSMPTQAGTSWWKYFYQVIVPWEVKSDAAGREAIYSKFKWLYLPGECTSDQIKSIGIWFTARVQDSGLPDGKGRVARVRIKDSGGNPVTINKLATKSLLIEYTHQLVSI